MSASPCRADAVQVEEVAVRVARDALYRAHLPNGGAKLSRLELEIALEGEGANAHLSGVSVLGGHADVTTHITHAAGQHQSTQLFKHVAGGKRAPSIRARSRSRKAPTNPTAARPPRRCCWASAPKPISSPSWKSSPTT